MTTDPADAESLFSELVERHGGIANMSPLDTEIASIVVKLLVEMRAAPADNVARLAETISNLTSTLPKPLGDEPDDYDLKRLTDEQLAQLDEINRTARDITAPAWQAPDPPAERPMGECEQRAVALGRYLDLHCHEWQGRELTENERIAVMNLAGDIGYPANLLLRNIWEPLWRAERESAVSAAVIATEDRLTKATKSAGHADPSFTATPEPAPEPPDNVLNILGYTFPGTSK